MMTKGISAADILLKGSKNISIMNALKYRTLGTCTNFSANYCTRPFEEELEEDGEIGVLAISHVIIMEYRNTRTCIETLVGYVICLKGLIAAAISPFEL